MATKITVTIDIENDPVLKEHPDTKSFSPEDKEKWYKHNKNFLYDIVREFLKKGTLDDIDDLFQNAWVSLEKAMKTYDPTNEAKFTTYARYVILHDILMKERREHTKKRDTSKNISLDMLISKISEGKGDKNDFADFRKTDSLHDEDVPIEDLVHHRLLVSDLYEAIDRVCTEEEKSVLAYLLSGKTQHDFGIDFCISDSKISTIMRSAYLKLYRELSPYRSTMW